jgi:hypothetical protein
VFVEQQPLTVEIASEPMQVATGMMFRTNLPANAGMLFVFPNPEPRSFWMKNCVMPLSAAYVDSEGVIREIHELEPGNTNSVMSRSRLIQYVLEVNRGWFDQHGLKPGAVIRTERGSLRETFFRYQPVPGSR